MFNFIFIFLYMFSNNNNNDQYNINDKNKNRNKFKTTQNYTANKSKKQNCKNVKKKTCHQTHLFIFSKIKFNI